jgi:hypothetical protein
LVRKSGGSRLLVKARCKWENNTNVELKETGRKGVDWMWSCIGTRGRLM